MAKLNGSETEKNLLKAFAGESQARNRYTYFANTARKQGYEPIVGKFPFTALGRAVAVGETEGFVKVVADKETEQILGVHMVGTDVTDLISEATLAIEMGATLEDLALTVHPHPTLPESLMEAAEAAKGRPINIMKSP